MLRTIILHGALADEFGESYPLDIASPAEAIRALCIMVAGFRERLREGAYAIVRGRIADGESLNEESLNLQLGAASELHIVPVIEGGSFFSENFSLILGVTLLAVAFFMPAAIAGLSFAGVTLGGVTVAIGASLAIHGIAQMLAPAAQTQNGSVDQLPSFLFGGLNNNAAQGGPVPLVYGRTRVGSVEVSGGIETEQLGVLGSTSVLGNPFNKS